MFAFLKHKKKEKKEKKQEPEQLADHPQTAKDGLYRGMYCPACGYMEVNQNSSALPLEGFAMCPNCGAPLKTADFIQTKDGFALAAHAVAVKKKIQTGGHYRVRKAGPNRTKAKAGRPIRNRR